MGAIHVPNLVESRRVNPRETPNSQPGDGRYTCRLFQKGAQKIVGFEFGASVTMDMKENIQMLDGGRSGHNSMNGANGDGVKAAHAKIIPQKRSIDFKCVDSQFFSVFDGEWMVSPTIDPEDPTRVATKIEYSVDVRPRGPVPVAALEWRIREDVPSNLRAVKQASIELGRNGVEQLLERQKSVTDQGIRQLEGRVITDVRQVTKPAPSDVDMQREPLRTTVMTASSASPGKRAKPISKLSPVRVQWYEDETMAAYLRKRRS